MTEDRRTPTPQEAFQPGIINGNFKGKDILSIAQFDPDSLVKLFEIADRIRDIDMLEREHASRILEGIIVGFCFTELPSFNSEIVAKLLLNSAVVRLGGSALIVNRSSPSERETLEDAIDILRFNCDLVVSGDSKVKLTQKAMRAALSTPLINVDDSLIQELSNLYAASKNSGKMDHASLEDETGNKLYVGMALLTLVLGKDKSV